MSHYFDNCLQVVVVRDSVNGKNGYLVLLPIQEFCKSVKSFEVFQNKLLKLTVIKTKKHSILIKMTETLFKDVSRRMSIRLYRVNKGTAYIL